MPMKAVYGPEVGKVNRLWSTGAAFTLDFN